MSEYLKAGVGMALVVMLALAGWFGWRHFQVASQWEREVQLALADAEAAGAARRAAEALADSLQQVAKQAEARADEAGRRARERVEVVREVEVPVYAVPFTAPRDSIIDDLVTENYELREVIISERAASASLRVALGRVTASEASLKAVLDARPGPAPWWRPSMGLGAFAGACSDGRMCSGIGLTMSFRIPTP